jgi:hypothetical protein
MLVNKSSIVEKGKLYDQVKFIPGMQGWFTLENPPM